MNFEIAGVEIPYWLRFGVNHTGHNNNNNNNFLPNCFSCSTQLQFWPEKALLLVFLHTCAYKTQVNAEQAKFWDCLFQRWVNTRHSLSCIPRLHQLICQTDFNAAALYRSDLCPFWLTMPFPSVFNRKLTGHVVITETTNHGKCYDLTIMLNPLF